MLPYLAPLMDAKAKAVPQAFLDRIMEDVEKANVAGA